MRNRGQNVYITYYFIASVAISENYPLLIDMPNNFDRREDIPGWGIKPIKLKIKRRKTMLFVLGLE